MLHWLHPGHLLISTVAAGAAQGRCWLQTSTASAQIWLQAPRLYGTRDSLSRKSPRDSSESATPGGRPRPAMVCRQARAGAVVQMPVRSSACMFLVMEPVTLVGMGGQSGRLSGGHRSTVAAWEARRRRGLPPRLLAWHLAITEPAYATCTLLWCLYPRRGASHLHLLLRGDGVAAPGICQLLLPRPSLSPSLVRRCSRAAGAALMQGTH